MPEVVTFGGVTHVCFTRPESRPLSAAYVRDVTGPLPNLRLVATSGVNLENAGASIKAGACAVGVGSSLVNRATVASGNLDVLTQRAPQKTERNER